MGILESSSGSLVLLERADSEVIKRHEDFRIFAAMNPATDSGKRHLPPQIRAHFTELNVSEPCGKADLVRCH
jgi:midasin